MGTSQTIAPATPAQAPVGPTASLESPSQTRSSRQQDRLGNAGVMAQVPPPEVDPPRAQGPTATSTPLQRARARQILDDAFGNYREISAGNVRLLAQADFQQAYDAVYGSTPYAWATYVVPQFGNLNGFAHEGVNYINQAAANVTTVPHEMLHNNTAGDWTGVVGAPFNEGATEYLEQYALHHAGIHTTLTHYPNQRSVGNAFLAAGQSEDQLFTAYLVGGADDIVRAWVDANCSGTWSQVKTATEQSQWATAIAHLAPRSAGSGATVAPTGGVPAAGSMSVHVQVTNQSVEDGSGTPEFFTTVEVDGQRRETPVGDISTSGTRTFRVDLAAVPTTNIRVKVWEDDAFLTGGDDLLADVDWAPPFAGVTTSGNGVNVSVRKEGS